MPELKMISDSFMKKSARGYSERRAKYLCSCGKIFETRVINVRIGATTSCGCYGKKARDIANKTHGLSKTKLYRVYIDIKRRCYKENYKQFKYYGGRGIIMCKEWLEDSEKFLVWAKENGYKEGLQIDRIDNNGNYEPLNCRFVSAKENTRNTRWNRMIEYKGESKCLTEWCEFLNLKYTKIAGRIKIGWDAERAFET